MAARFPQSGTSVTYRIKPAWASKIHVIYWAAGSDSLHRLRSGDTASTIITRSATAATFNSSQGTIAGNISSFFNDSIAGGYGALRENSNFSIGASWWGDCFSGLPTRRMGIASATPPDTFGDGVAVMADSYNIKWQVHTQTGYDIGGATTNDVVDWMTVCLRTDQADATAKQRVWLNGSEFTTTRQNITPSSTSLIGDTSRPLYIGGSAVTNTNTKAEFECAWIGAVLSDADMATITANPADVIELVVSYAYVRPASDITTQWTPSTGTAHYDCINEAVASDTDYIGAPAPGLTDEVAYAQINSVQASTNMVFRYRVQGTAGGAKLTYSVYNGATLVKSDTQRSSDGDYELTVTPTDLTNAGVTFPWSPRGRWVSQ